MRVPATIGPQYATHPRAAASRRTSDLWHSYLSALRRLAGPIDEAGADVRSGYRALLGTAEPPVAIAREPVVAAVAQCAWQEAGQREQPPAPAQPMQHSEKAVGFGQQALVRRIGTDHEIHRVEIARVTTVADQDTAGELALQRGKMKEA